MGNPEKAEKADPVSETVKNKFKPTPTWILIITGIALVIAGVAIGIYFGIRIEKHRNFQYKAINEKMTYDKAKDYCKKKHKGHVWYSGKWKTKKDRQEMLKKCKDLKENVGYWVGLEKKDKKDWEDIDGEKYGDNSEFEGWDTNFGKEDTNYLAIYNDDAKLRDYKVDAENYFICQYE